MTQHQQCEHTGKRCFSSKRHARRGMRRLRATLRVYLCRFCRWYHLTSQRRGPA